MKIENFEKFGKGKGTQENPILIEPSEILPRYLKIEKSTYYIHFKDCTFDSLIIKKCQNVKIFRSTFGTLHLEKSSNIKIQECKFNETLTLLKSQRIKLDDCNINHFNLLYSYSNQITNCKLNSSMNQFSRANTFKEIKFSENSEKYIGDLTKSTVIKKAYFYLIFVLITVTIPGTFRLLEIGLSEALWFLTIMCLLIMIGIIGFFLNYQKAKRYEPNKIL